MNPKLTFDQAQLAADYGIVFMGAPKLALMDREKGAYDAQPALVGEAHGVDHVLLGLRLNDELREAIGLAEIPHGRLPRRLIALIAPRKNRTLKLHTNPSVAVRSAKSIHICQLDAMTISAHHVGLTVTDIDRSQAWYGTALGFELKRFKIGTPPRLNCHSNFPVSA